MGKIGGVPDVHVRESCRQLKKYSQAKKCITFSNRFIYQQILKQIGLISKMLHNVSVSGKTMQNNCDVGRGLENVDSYSTCP